MDEIQERLQNIVHCLAGILVSRVMTDYERRATLKEVWIDLNSVIKLIERKTNETDDKNRAANGD